MTGIIAKRNKLFHEMKLPKSTAKSQTATLSSAGLPDLLTADGNRLLVAPSEERNSPVYLATNLKLHGV